MQSFWKFYIFEIVLNSSLPMGNNNIQVFNGLGSNNLHSN